jgi:hypothetical protein
MDELLAHRWTARDRELNESVLAIQAEMQRRGMLTCSISVKAHHDVFHTEFQASKSIIIITVIDSLQSKNAKLERSALQAWASKRLSERRDALDSLFRRRADVSIRALQNQGMIAPFMSVAQYHDHESQELSIELNRALDEYESHLGATLTDRVVNRFKNHPVVAWGIIVLTVLFAILGLISAFREAGS